MAAAAKEGKNNYLPSGVLSGGVGVGYRTFKVVSIWVAKSLGMARVVAFEQAKLEQWAFFGSLVSSICRAFDLALWVAKC